MAVKKWRPYLLSSTFVIQTNYHSLKYLLEQQIGTTNQQKWISKLLGYEFTIEFKTGHTNKVSDALSRCGVEDEPTILTTISFPTPV